MNALPKTQPEVLFDEYRQIRKVDISLTQFFYILNLYPSLLVCMSDEILDREEWDSILKMAKSLAVSAENGQEQKRLELVFQKELKYLLENAGQWEKKFLNTLKAHVAQSREDKEFVLESMYLFANAANGISDVEREKIEVLSDRLSLTF